MATDPQSISRPARTVVEKLAAPIARLRAQLHNQVGDRPMRFFLVVRSWSGNEAGRGTATIKRTEIGCGPLPGGAGVGAPKVTLAGGFSPSMRGVVPTGMAIVEDIDPTLTDAQLAPHGRASAGDEIWYEIQPDGRDGAGSDLPVHRFTLDGPPTYGPSGISRILTLRAQEGSAPFANAALGADGGAP